MVMRRRIIYEQRVVKIGICNAEMKERRLVSKKWWRKLREMRAKIPFQV